MKNYNYDDEESTHPILVCACVIIFFVGLANVAKDFWLAMSWVFNFVQNIIQ